MRSAAAVACCVCGFISDEAGEPMLALPSIPASDMNKRNLLFHRARYRPYPMSVQRYPKPRGSCASMKFILLILRSLVFASICAAFIEGRAAEMQHLSVLFIVAEALRPDLGCSGNAAVHSPNIDRLASRGLVFD